MKAITNALDILKRMTGDGAEIRNGVERAHLSFEVAEMIFEARRAASLTQRELADLAGTRQSVIARLEDAKYEGHSLTMLQRIATALGLRVRVQFTPVAGNRQSAKARVKAPKRARRVA